MTFKINTDSNVAVAMDYYWIPISDDTPKHVKLQLLSKGGVACYGHWDGKNTFWTHWAPMPRIRKETE